MMQRDRISSGAGANGTTSVIGRVG